MSESHQLCMLLSQLLSSCLQHTNTEHGTRGESSSESLLDKTAAESCLQPSTAAVDGPEREDVQHWQKCSKLPLSAAVQTQG